MWWSESLSSIAAVGEAEHPVGVRALAGQQRRRGEPEQTGAAQNAWRNSTPWSASRWMFGVGTGWPYGCT